MFNSFNGSTADEVWQQIAESFRSGMFTKAQESRAGSTHELLHATIAIADPRQRWVVSRQPTLNIAFALAEIIWIVQGRNDSAFLNFFNTQLPKFAGNQDTYHGAYGYRLRVNFGLDQLQRAYDALSNNRDSRQIVLQIWDATKDFPDSHGQAIATDVPCNISSLLKVRNGRLEWLQVMRSNDLFRGLPYNIVQFTALQEILAGWLELEIGEYHHVSDSLHVYDNTSEHMARSMSGDKVFNTDDLCLPKEKSEEIFSQLEELILLIVNQSEPLEIILSRISPTWPPAYVNMGVIIIAEGARRRGEIAMMTKCLSHCNNPVYKRIYSAWLSRMTGIS